MHKILFVKKDDYLFEPRSMKEAQSLKKAGYDVSFLGLSSEGSAPLYEEKDGFIYHRIELKKEDIGLKSKIFVLLMWNIKVFVWLLKNAGKYDYFHCCNFESAMPALLVAKLFRKKFVYDVFDFYADSLRKIPAGVKNIIRKIELYVISHADATIIVDDSRKLQIAGSRPKKLVVIYNSPPDLYQDNNKQNPKDKIKICFIGLLLEERGLKALLEAVSSRQDMELITAGYGEMQEEVQRYASKYKNITYYGKIPYDIVLELTSGADCVYACYDPGIPNHKYTSPNKAFEAMMLAKAVITAKGTGISDVVEKNDIGYVINYNDRIQLSEVFDNMLADRDKLKEQGIRARKLYLEKYSWLKMQERLRDLYAGIELILKGKSRWR